jgi:hypothetical protein
MGKPYIITFVPLIPPVFTKKKILENEYIAGLSDSYVYI